MGTRTIAGYVYDAAHPDARPIVELLIDGLPVALARAEHFVEDLYRAGIGDARYGFAFTLTPEMLRGGGLAQIAVANHGLLALPSLDLLAGATDRDVGTGTGAVEWHGGLELTGWISPEREGVTPRVLFSIDGTAVAETVADRWRHHSDARGTRPVHAFCLHLPERYADGRTRRVSVTSGRGEPLRGSPISILAFPEPLEVCAARAYGPDSGVIGERARLFDRLLPRSAPLNALDRWLAEHPAPAGPPASVAIALVGTDSTLVGRTLASLKAQPNLAWVVGALPSADGIGYNPRDLERFLVREAQGRSALILAPAGTEFVPSAPARLATALAADPSTRLIYGDVVVGPPGSEVPLAFPAFDYERWLEQGYGALSFAVPPALAVRSGADSLYALASAAFSPGRPSDVLHLPGLAARVPRPDREAGIRHLVAATHAHLSARGVMARLVPAGGVLLPAVRVMRAAPLASVSVIVAIRDRVDRLRSCLDSIRDDIATRSCELIVVDNDSSDPATLAFLAQLRRDGVQVLQESGPFNRAHLYNRAVTRARGTFVLFLDTGVATLEPGWLDELLGRAADPGVDAVGAVLRWPSGVIRHGGIVLGPGFAVRPAFDDRLADDPGYGDLLRVASEPSAVSGACLLVRREAYLAVGGMDAVHFATAFHDVDLCLKLRARGGAIVLTPHLKLCHGRMDSGLKQRPDQVRRRARELEILRDRWGDLLAADPGYNPMLALTDQPYTGLAWPPRSWAARRRVAPRPQPLPFGR